jgi:hypothetical protein
MHDLRPKPTIKTWKDWALCNWRSITALRSEEEAFEPSYSGIDLHGVVKTILPKLQECFTVAKYKSQTCQEIPHNQRTEEVAIGNPFHSLNSLVEAQGLPSASPGAPNRVPPKEDGEARVEEQQWKMCHRTRGSCELNPGLKICNGLISGRPLRPLLASSLN